MLRGVCNNRFKFAIEYGNKRGTTENTYVIKDGKDSILIDVPDETFADDFVRTLESVVALKDLRTVVITHLTPKRMASFKALLERRARTLFGAGPLDIHLSNPALQLLRSSLGSDEEGAKLLSKATLHAARSADGVAVGRNGRLRLLPLPTPRWPDLLVVHSAEDRLLFTSKLFAAHISPAAAGAEPGDAGDDAGWGVYGPEWRFYFDCMLAPVARQAAVALERLDVMAAPRLRSSNPLSALAAVLRVTQAALEASQASAFGAQSIGAGGPSAGLVATALCPMHGPVVQRSLSELLRQYREWTQEQIAAAERGVVAVLYASAYGNTAALAQAISRGVTKAGVGVETLNLEVATLDEVADTMARSAGFVVGSPTLGGHMPTQVQTALGAVLRNGAAREQPCGVFGSFGWSGEAVDEMEGRLKDAGFTFAFAPVRVKFKPSARGMQVAEESGTDLAQAVRRRLRVKEKQASSGGSTSTRASATEQAVGRLVGAMCAVTARDGDAQSAMLASWISQASFDPPGFTVAVKRDRAAEALLLTGAKFVVNILAEGAEKAVVKQLLRPFKPGEDRFAGMDVQESEESGCAILPGIAAYLEAEVVSRLEAGDHWIVYAKVNAGRIMEEGALSAVHHRKVGTTY
ncbi:hypothetical protein WJX81_005946 [Elliptochloris bilobata]|uniref:Flavodoxin-like domain-containing protein n=1 Tax=Elliptochloris bilobata TaxID=381761 RepID=A0AAW1R0Z4_9CHLO